MTLPKNDTDYPFIGADHAKGILGGSEELRGGDEVLMKTCMQPHFHPYNVSSS
jgi:hypothetical protein